MAVEKGFFDTQMHHIFTQILWREPSKCQGASCEWSILESGTGSLRLGDGRVVDAAPSTYLQLRRDQPSGAHGSLCPLF
jgi:hypothetical protein